MDQWVWGAFKLYHNSSVSLAHNTVLIFILSHPGVDVTVFCYRLDGLQQKIWVQEFWLYCCSKRNSPVGSQKLHLDSQDVAFLLECVLEIFSPNHYPSEGTLEFESNKVIFYAINCHCKKISFFKHILITSDNERSCTGLVQTNVCLPPHSAGFSIVFYKTTFSHSLIEMSFL